jgi:hypothetical protein
MKTISYHPLMGTLQLAPDAVCEIVRIFDMCGVLDEYRL